MMKHIVLVLFIFQSNLFGQEFQYLKADLDDSCTVIKTVIDTANYYEQLVFIDYKSYSELKKPVSNFTIDKDGHTEINRTYEMAVKNNSSKPIKIQHGLPEKWIMLHKYKNDWILYNNIEFNYRHILTDSSLIRFFMDGKYSTVINEYDNNSGSHNFSMISLNPFDEDSNEEVIINVKIINTKYMIALWEFSIGTNTDHFLMIPEEKKFKFPIIGIRTTDLMGDESEILDKIDFENLKQTE